jgi:hypothetical protein
LLVARDQYQTTLVGFVIGGLGISLLAVLSHAGLRSLAGVNLKFKYENGFWSRWTDHLKTLGTYLLATIFTAALTWVVTKFFDGFFQ